ncbi:MULTISPECIES: hypothetical protein [Actinokineospora]|uniref:Uncharacterized protein n=1 Tax=Actinokineospora fastidiosa TaxID=1816 RepID=A0A918G151_9PSEU|nr:MULTISPECIES: hypothetical protein [Actinokineospora]UVS77204.1 hypothetical protein Actkin_00906 [Actinokineospora sp. UTMC 2448]GGS12774.1 hypothetical protein GCM10010171_00550 [Actinokineospora fastidiosa]
MTLAHETAPVIGRAAAREQETRHHAEACAKAMLTVADHATDATDCKLLLEMLGLDTANREAVTT